MSLWLSKGERTHCSPQFSLQPRACRACLLQKAPTRQQRLDVAKTVKPVGQQGSSLTSNPPQAPSTKSHPVSPSPSPSSPKRTESLFFPRHLSPDATSSRLLSSHSHSLSSSRTTRVLARSSTLHLHGSRPSLFTIFTRDPTSHLPIVERTLRHLYRRLFRSIAPRPSLPLAPRPLQLRLRASPLAAMSSSDDDMPLSRTNGHGKSSIILAMFHSPPCGAVSPVVAPNARRHELTCHNSSPTSCHLCLLPSTQPPKRHC